MTDPNQITPLDFRVKKNNLHQSEFNAADHLSELIDGQVRLKIDQFAFTANNITYAAFGEQMAYWQFFPSNEPSWGRIPVWGFADVIESRHEGVQEGERLYGYFPMSKTIDLTPAKVTEIGFFDGAEHRRELHGVYNQYTRCSHDPGYKAELENEQMIYRPLFMTSFMIDDFLDDQEFFGASQVILSSASSKTSFGLAHLLFKNRRQQCKVIGLTSAGNVDFVKSLGCYDQVISYEDLEQLSADTETVYVDMAGNGELRARVHQHFGQQLNYSCAVGGAHWDQMNFSDTLPGPKPTLFFAPAQIKKRTSEWGIGGFQQRTADAWNGFLQTSQGWINIHRQRGEQAVEQTYLSLLDGQAKPDQGHVLSLWEE